MLKLLSPAGSAEAVIAAVQSGADIVHIGFGASEAEREGGFTSGELARCLRYCRVRGCRAVVAVGELCSDETLPRAVERAVYAARAGADALLVQDLGLAAALRTALPETPLWAGVRLGLRTLAEVLAAKALGFSRIMLPPGLTLEQIAQIAQNAGVPVGVCVHGPMCFARMGRCHMSALLDSGKSDSALRCSEPCRGRFSLGGRMDDCPLSSPDLCLIEHLEELEEAGADCAVIAGRSRRPEYVAYVTGLYARAIREGALPTEEERERLTALFAPWGLRDTLSERDTVFFGEERPAGRALERALARIRRDYMGGEYRRVPVTFYAVLQRGSAARFAAEDAEGRRAVYEGYAPVDLGRQGITPERVRDILYRTGGTPYTCVSVQCSVEPGLDYPDEAIEQARRALLSKITDHYREPPEVVTAPLPALPAREPRSGPPAFLVQISRADQLTPALLESRPDRVYLPAELLAAGALDPGICRDAGVEMCAVLPGPGSDDELPVLRRLLEALPPAGIREVLVGTLGEAVLAGEAGFIVRGGLGLHAANRWAVLRLSALGLASVTASFQLAARQIRGLTDAADVEMLVYGRVPVMLTDTCLIRLSSGRCSCATPTGMSDTAGGVYPVEKALGCRNVVYDRRKIFLADRPDVYKDIGLWGIRLLFTTESARECADVARRYRGGSDYLPINISRGLYGRGAL